MSVVGGEGGWGREYLSVFKFVYIDKIYVSLVLNDFKGHQD